MAEISVIIMEYGLAIVGLAVAGYGAFLNRFQGETEKGFKFLVAGIVLWVIWAAMNYL